MIRPKQGQEVEANPVRLVVRAGPDHGDLRAQLNGQQVGEQFARRPGKRVLKVSNSHGLRHGENVLRVAVRDSASRVRRQTVRFTVAHHRPLVGADQDQLIPSGTTLELGGDVVNHPRGPGAEKVRWRIIKAPEGSRLASRDASERAGAEADALDGESTQTPTFTPDTNGDYVLEHTAVVQGDEVSDQVTVSAGPTSQLVELDTAVERDGTSQYGIHVGEQTFTAPPMHEANGQGSYVGSSNVWSHYASLWQVLVLDRTTLGFVENKTYGWCEGSQGTGICEKGDNGEPFLVLSTGNHPAGSAESLAEQLNAFGPERLVIAVNHWDNDQSWGGPNTGGIATRGLSAIGFPATAPPEFAYGNPSAAAVGVPGMAPGDADYIATQRAALWGGYLVPDPLHHFGFMPDERHPFDTRAAETCDAAAGTCTVTQEIAGETYRGTLEDGHGGYLVTALDQHSLGLEESRVFDTAGPLGDFDGAALRMEQFLNERGGAGNVVVITSLETPKQQPRPVTYNSSIRHDTWKSLADAIAELGGTRHRFNTAAATPNTSYTLVGWGGALEGDAEESIAAGGVLRGALVPDGSSQFRPANTLATGQPAERLNQLLIKPPSDAWPLAGDPGASAALADIGLQAQLTSDPRAAYVHTLHRSEDVTEFRESVELAEPSPGATYTAAQFAAAQRQLLLELTQVRRVRLYMEKLASPAAANNTLVWQDVSKLADRLKADLDVAAQNAQRNFNGFSFFESLLDIAGAFVGDPEIGKTITAIAGLSETAAVFYDTDYDGSSAVEDDPRIRADELADRLQEEARTTIVRFERMGDVVVSDPVKLAEVGRYGNCASPCAPGYEEYTTDKIEDATSLAENALERGVYEHLVPLSFQIWDTGLTASQDVSAYDCEPDPYSPFFTDGPSAPDLAYTRALDDFDPTGNLTRSRISIMVHHGSELSDISWPDQQILNTMFGEVSAGGLGIVPQDLMREAWREGPPTRYVPGGADASCAWPDG